VAWIERRRIEQSRAEFRCMGCLPRERDMVRGRGLAIIGWLFAVVVTLLATSYSVSKGSVVCRVTHGFDEFCGTKPPPPPPPWLALGLAGLAILGLIATVVMTRSAARSRRS
jgi:MYXO-CTERM domain-containing protein